MQNLVHYSQRQIRLTFPFDSSVFQYLPATFLLNLNRFVDKLGMSLTRRFPSKANDTAMWLCEKTGIGLIGRPSIIYIVKRNFHDIFWTVTVTADWHILHWQLTETPWSAWKLPWQTENWQLKTALTIAAMSSGAGVLVSEAMQIQMAGEWGLHIKWDCSTATIEPLNPQATTHGPTMFSCTSPTKSNRSWSTTTRLAWRSRHFCEWRDWSLLWKWELTPNTCRQQVSQRQVYQTRKKLLFDWQVLLYFSY